MTANDDHATMDFVPFVRRLTVTIDGITPLQSRRGPGQFAALARALPRSGCAHLTTESSMILHASIAADDPEKTAQTLATLIGGRALPLPGDGGAWGAFTGDEHGTMIEVLGRGREYHFQAGEHTQMVWGDKTRNNAFHLMIETPLDETAVLGVAQGAGFRAHRARHAVFDVIEFWIDDCQLIDVVTPEMAHAYSMFTGMLTRALLAPASAS